MTTPSTQPTPTSEPAQEAIPETETNEEFLKLIGRKQLDLMRAGGDPASMKRIEASYAAKQQELLTKIASEQEAASQSSQESSDLPTA